MHGPYSCRDASSSVSWGAATPPFRRRLRSSFPSPTAKKKPMPRQSTLTQQQSPQHSTGRVDLLPHKRIYRITMDMAAGPPLPASPSQPDALIDHAASITYWNSVSADTTGMLGGYPQTSRIDLQGSSNFLIKLRRTKSSIPARDALPPLNRAADCGAGVGRITKEFLLKVAKRVDVVEPVKKFTDELVQGLKSGEWAGDGADPRGGRGQVGEVVNLGLQDWTPEVGAYDLIWNQWCVGHLTDVQLVDYLERCKNGLVEGNESWIVVKENMSTDIHQQDIYDDEDSSVTRSDDKFRKLFKEAGLKLVATDLQRGFPKELFPVRIYALQPQQIGRKALDRPLYPGIHS
ncbi:DUF858-domain-containing protein [Massarina eburnea CBS 473.64]|uniref:Alpha N-terminal protein methyltransferase 1 n=1 Tax=Massarina eburnea CBS 473.64 TaxID=1395130 RepID=A0A6A6S7P6_9PLEO|nr:DUF858-domain-containing protein [Massarina eburnea CBS 473.64]